MIKNKRLFIVMIVLVIISIICGLLFISILSVDNKKLIVESIKTNLNTSPSIYKCLSNNLLLNIFNWLLGISIIGIPIIIIILLFKSFLLGFSFSSIIYTYNFKGIFKALIYLIPNIINLLVLFILDYYAIKFSISLFNYLFKKCEFNRRIIVKNYLKLLIIIIIISIISSNIETFIIPKLLKLISH